VSLDLNNILYILGKGQKRAIDLIRFELDQNKVVYSFLSFTWAIMADIDLESEMYYFITKINFLLKKF